MRFVADWKSVGTERFGKRDVSDPPLLQKEQNLTISPFSAIIGEMSQLESECLKLNRNWLPISIIRVRDAFEDAAAGAVTFLKFQDGYPSIFRLEDWLKLEVEDGDDYVTTSRMHGLKKILVPRVCICVTYAKLLAKEQPCTPENLLRRYGHKDAVTGKKLKRDKFSREHVIPKSKGGNSGWENLVPMDKEQNSRRGNRPYQEAGLREPKILPAPKPLLPINSLVNRYGYNEWDLFHIPRPTETT